MRSVCVCVTRSAHAHEVQIASERLSRLRKVIEAELYMCGATLTSELRCASNARALNMRYRVGPSSS